jgi:hypothetical protein
MLLYLVNKWFAVAAMMDIHQIVNEWLRLDKVGFQLNHSAN